LKKLGTLFTLVTVLFFSVTVALAEGPAKGKKIYKEMEFIQTFKGKNKQFVLDTLGKPMKKQTPTKPTGADSYVGKAVPGSEKQGGEKQDVIEMWYYPNLVLYNSKDTFKKTELTFINDRCTNLTFVN
jgi:hypothetical protein